MKEFKGLLGDYIAKVEGLYSTLQGDSLWMKQSNSSIWRHVLTKEREGKLYAKFPITFDETCNLLFKFNRSELVGGRITLEKI